MTVRPCPPRCVFTSPPFDLARPFLAADNVNGTVVMAFQAAQTNGQGQIEFVLDGRRRNLELAGAARTEHDGAPVLPVPGGVGWARERDLLRLPR